MILLQNQVSGLNYYNYRTYDPLSGRWVYRDPFEERRGPNLFAINFNDCINNGDILGLMPSCPTQTNVHGHTWEKDKSPGEDMPDSTGWSNWRNYEELIPVPGGGGLAPPLRVLKQERMKIDKDYHWEKTSASVQVGRNQKQDYSYGVSLSKTRTLTAGFEFEIGDVGFTGGLEYAVTSESNNGISGTLEGTDQYEKYVLVLVKYVNAAVEFENRRLGQPDSVKSHNFNTKLYLNTLGALECKRCACETCDE